MLRTILTICALTVFGMTSLSAIEQEGQKETAAEQCNLAGCRGCKKKNNKNKKADSSKEEVLVGCGQNDEDQNPALLLACGKCK